MGERRAREREQPKVAALGMILVLEPRRLGSARRDAVVTTEGLPQRRHLLLDPALRDKRFRLTVFHRLQPQEWIERGVSADEERRAEIRLREEESLRVRQTYDPLVPVPEFTLRTVLELTRPAEKEGRLRRPRLDAQEREDEVLMNESPVQDVGKRTPALEVERRHRDVEGVVEDGQVVE